MTIEDIIVSMAGIKPHLIRELARQIDSSEDLWQLSSQQLNILGLSDTNIRKIFSADVRQKAEQECEFLYKNDIKAISLFDASYPRMLSECIDAPYIIYCRGKFDFNQFADRAISVIGTRRSSPYGEQACAKIISEISVSHPTVSIVSGLAYGIDAAAHTCALKSGLKTIGVVAHGLETIQPTAHYSLAKDIVSAGGAIISEYPSNSPVFRHNFVARNRIVAGLSVATIVIETPLKGGAMITASLANDYDRELFAVPGRVSDPNSQGCNNLIKSSKAQLLQGVEDLEYYMGWSRVQLVLDLFKPDLSGVERQVYDCFDTVGELTSEEIIQKIGITASQFYQAATALELDGHIKSVRGKMYIKS